MFRGAAPTLHVLQRSHVFNSPLKTTHLEIPLTCLLNERYGWPALRHRKLSKQPLKSWEVMKLNKIFPLAGTVLFIFIPSSFGLGQVQYVEKVGGAGSFPIIQPGVA